MCNPQALERLRPLQVKPKPLYCTGSNNCWCFKLDTMLPHHPGYDVCLGPQELLEVYSTELTSSDINYLKSIEHKECRW
jgi:hypothetical protein